MQLHRTAFTLIEILVTLIMLTIIMAVVVPVGSNMLDQFSRITEQNRAEHDFQLKRMQAFAQGKTEYVMYEDLNYTLKSNGIMLHVSRK